MNTCSCFCTSRGKNFKIRQRQWVWLYLLLCARPTLFGHFWLPFGCGIRVCFFFSLTMVGKSFSFLYIFCCYYPIIGRKITNFFWNPNFFSFLSFKQVRFLSFHRLGNKTIAFTRWMNIWKNAAKKFCHFKKRIYICTRKLNELFLIIKKIDKNKADSSIG